MTVAHIQQAHAFAEHINPQAILPYGLHLNDVKATLDDVHKEEHSPFQFIEVLAAQLEKTDWSAQGRRSGSRRTPTASIVASGTAKLRANWIYRYPDFSG